MRSEPTGLKVNYLRGRSNPLDLFLPDISACAKYNPEYMTTANCIASDFYSTQFVEFCRKAAHTPFLHRKLWEFAFVYENLVRNGAIRAGARGIGFGVGTEPLPALFISEGCQIVATDAPPDIGQEWSLDNQWSEDIRGLLWPAIAEDDLVRENLEFRFCDMKNLPDDDRNYDFCWSACCFEHLGSIKDGADFVIESVEKLLVPGGVACHTSEFNLSSNDETVMEGPTVLYRRRDIEELAGALRARGHDVQLGTFEPGNSFIDGLVDLPPYENSPHLRLQLGDYVTTSFGITIKRAA